MKGQMMQPEIGFRKLSWNTSFKLFILTFSDPLNADQSGSFVKLSWQNSTL